MSRDAQARAQDVGEIAGAQERSGVQPDIPTRLALLQTEALVALEESTRRLVVACEGMAAALQQLADQGIDLEEEGEE